MGESVEVLEAKLHTLRHIKNFIDYNIKARKEEIKQSKKGG